MDGGEMKRRLWKERELGIKINRCEEEMEIIR